MAIVEQGYEANLGHEDHNAQIIEISRKVANPFNELSNERLVEIFVEDFALATQLGFDSRGIAGRYAIRSLVSGVLSSNPNIVTTPRCIANKRWVGELTLAIESLISRI